MDHSTLRMSLWKLLGLLALLAILSIPQAALAQGGTCIDDLTGRDNPCAANDVGLTLLQNDIPTSCKPGELVTLHLTSKLIATANERYDIGVFLALDGGAADTGACAHDYLPPPLSAGGTCSVSGDTCRKSADCPAGETCTGGYIPIGGNPYLDAEPESETPDLCGDLEQGVETIRYLAPVTVLCMDANGDGYLDIGTAVSWDNQRTNLCLTVSDAIPNTGAKCRFDRVTVGNVIVEPGEIQVTKVAVPTQVIEPGGEVTFTFTVLNPSTVEVALQTLSDSVYGALQEWADGDCEVPQTLSPGGSYECSIHAGISGAPGVHQDTVTAAGVDQYQNPVQDTATVQVELVGLAPAIAVTTTAAPTSIKEPGGLILYTVTVKNNSSPSDPVALTSLRDNIYGDLTDHNNPKIKESTCQLVTIQPQQTYGCTFKAQVSGASGAKIIDTVTAQGADDEGTVAQASDDATVTILPDIPDTGSGLPLAAVAGGAMAVGVALLAAAAVVRRRAR